MSDGNQPDESVDASGHVPSSPPAEVDPATETERDDGDGVVLRSGDDAVTGTETMAALGSDADGNTARAERIVSGSG